MESKLFNFTKGVWKETLLSNALTLKGLRPRSFTANSHSKARSKDSGRGAMVDVKRVRRGKKNRQQRRGVERDESDDKDIRGLPLFLRILFSLRLHFLLLFLLILLLPTDRKPGSIFLRLNFDWKCFFLDLRKISHYLRVALGLNSGRIWRISNTKVLR